MVVLVSSVMLAGASAALANEWVEYVNPRFGTSADVPAEGFVPEAPPENGDGSSWTSLDGKGEIAIYGAFIEGIASNFEEYQNFTLDNARNTGVNVRYETEKADWFAYSGSLDDDIVYMKVVVTHDCDTLVGHHIYLKYPTTQRAYYDPIVERMARTLQGGDDTECQ